jgi:microcystin-dependent protein
MSVSNWMQPGWGMKQVARIMTVDPATRKIEAALKDGAMIHVKVWEVPTVFRWPLEGEIWTVRKDNGYWALDARYQNPHDDLSRVEAYEPGDTVIDGTVNIDYLDVYSDLSVGGDLAVEGSVTVEGDLTVTGVIHLPTGIVVPYTFTSAPDGWLPLNGDPVTTTHSSLRNLLVAEGSPWGTSSGNPLLPDMRGRTIVGIGQGTALTLRSLGGNGGAETHVLTEAQIPSHTHPEFGMQTVGGGGIQWNVQAVNQWVSAQVQLFTTTGATGGGLEHPNMQPWLALNYIIKT